MAIVQPNISGDPRGSAKVADRSATGRLTSPPAARPEPEKEPQKSSFNCSDTKHWPERCRPRLDRSNPRLHIQRSSPSLREQELRSWPTCLQQRNEF